MCPSIIKWIFHYKNGKSWHLRDITPRYFLLLKQSRANRAVTQNSHFGEQISQPKCILSGNRSRLYSLASFADWPMVLTDGIWVEEKRTISGAKNLKMCLWSLHVLSTFMWAGCKWWQLGPEKWWQSHKVLRTQSTELPHERKLLTFLSM